jgi:hypothetical protein
MRLGDPGSAAPGPWGRILPGQIPYDVSCGTCEGKNGISMDSLDSILYDMSLVHVVVNIMHCLDILRQ